MSFDSIIDRINNATFRTFAKTALVRVGANETEMQGIYRAPYTGESGSASSRIGGVQVNRPDPHIVFRLAEYQATGAMDGDVVENHAGTFTIVGAQPDSEGGTVDVTLRAFV